MSSKKLWLHNWGSFENIMVWVRHRRQLTFVPINGQLAAKGGGVEEVTRKGVIKSTADDFLHSDKNHF